VATFGNQSLQATSFWQNIRLWMSLSAYMLDAIVVSGKLAPRQA
jgi:hypothetical protein